MLRMISVQFSTDYNNCIHEVMPVNSAELYGIIFFSTLLQKVITNQKTVEKWKQEAKLSIG